MADGFLIALAESNDRKKRDREEFQAKLGEPLFFIQDDDDPRFGIGWFRGDVGFFSYRRYANGYDPHTKHVIEDALIKALLPHMPS